MACCVVLFLSTDLLLNSFSARGLLCQVACCAKWLACPTANSIALLHYRTPFCIVSSPTRFLDVILIEHADGLTSRPRKCNFVPRLIRTDQAISPKWSRMQYVSRDKTVVQIGKLFITYKHESSQNLDNWSVTVGTNKAQVYQMEELTLVQKEPTC